jgi:hypothetical protein
MQLGHIILPISASWNFDEGDKNKNNRDKKKCIKN